VSLLSYVRQTDPHKAGGPDNIPTQRTCISVLVNTNAYKQSLTTGNIPQEWKSAFVTLIFKKGNHLTILASIVCKTLEHILVNQIMKHLETEYCITANMDLELSIITPVNN